MNNSGGAIGGFMTLVMAIFCALVLFAEIG